MKLIANIIFFTIVTTELLAQYTSTPQGTFTVNEIKACAPFTIQLNAPTCDGSVGCDVDYTGNNTFRSVLFSDSFTYTTPGTYTIRLVRGVQVDNLTVQIYASPPPSFQVSNCGGNRVAVSITDNSYDQYVVNYGDGTGDFLVSPGGSNQHAYPASGTQTITVRGRKTGAADNCNSSSQTVNVLASLPTPTITLLQVPDNSSVRLEYDGQQNIQYKLEVAINNTTSFQQIKTLFNKTIDTVKNILPETNSYCFRIGAYNPCDNQTTYSPVICSVDIDLQISNNENRVTWTTASGSSIASQRITRITTSNNTAISTLESSPYTDTDINCGLEYCYQTIITYTNNSQSISLEICGIAISTDIPDPVNNISSIVKETGVDLIWVQDPGFTPEEFSVFRILNDLQVLLTTTSGQEYTDNEFDAENPSCYRIRYTDVCGNVSPDSQDACPVFLTGDVAADNIVSLSWTAYSGWANGVSTYILEQYDQDGTLLQTIDAGPVTAYSDDSQDLNNQVYIYRIRAIPVEMGIAESISNTIVIIKDPNLFYPTSFTPNGDALNDIFNVYGQYINEFEMDIFNRWGELMYTTNNLDQGWDGTFKGNPMPEGTYTFIARIKDLAGRSLKRSGSILLLRKNK